MRKFWTTIENAKKILYDNTNTGMSATNLQDAIDELHGILNSLAASSIDYDNSSSGLSATDVQSAIDEINSKVHDEKVKVSSNDTTADFLINKIVGGTAITVSEINNGGNEQLRISFSGTASDIPYNNSSSGLSATNVQDAIDELDSRLDELGV